MLIYKEKQGREQNQTHIGRGDESIDVEHHDGERQNEKQEDVLTSRRFDRLNDLYFYGGCKVKVPEPVEGPTISN